MNVLREQSGTNIILHWDNRLINFTDTMWTFVNYLHVQRAFLLPTSQELIVVPEVLENVKKRRKKKKKE